ncbi:MAG: NACHT domain-containing protein, partial [Chloroflexi bacterium]|nr:NACHT domain-containing protein [Chloroflexota bacterium]
MILEALLSATIEAMLGLLAEIGLGDAGDDLRERFLHTDAKKRSRALQKAFDAAMAAADDPEIQDFLASSSFREEVVRALLDPMRGFDLQSLQAQWGERLPEHALAVRRFFNALQNALLADEIWGPILSRYQELRFQKTVRDALEARQLPLTDEMLVRSVNQALTRYQAELHGNGAVAEGEGAKAVGSGGMLVEGDYHQIVRITINQFLGRATEEAAEDDLLRRYLDAAARQANLLPWAKVTTDYADPAGGEGLRLADVYIDLDTTELRHVEREEELRQFLRKQREAERISAQEMVSRHAKLLIMGDPGSGKSTFVKHLTYLMAQAGLAETPQAWLARLGEWEHGVLLPFWVELRHVAAFAGTHSKGNFPLILGYIRHALEEWGLAPFWDVLQARLASDDAQVLFLLDGLDEVPKEQRQQIVAAVNALCGLYPQQRYVVTCRPYAYVGQPWKLQGFHEVTLAPFSLEQIDHFIENWYEQLAARGRIPADEAYKKAQSLKQAVRRRDLLGLAERPLLMTVMAQLHAYKGKLPEDRTQLYADAVDLLLERWESRIDGSGVLEYLDIPGLKMSDLKSGLYRVAYEAHRLSPKREEAADIQEEQLRKWLAPYLNDDWNKAGAFIEFIRERAGLLIRHKPDAYTFPHRSFQEYLAACHWLSLPDYPSEAARLMREDWDRWREVLVLSTGYAARTDRLGLALAALNALLPENHQPGAAVSAEQARVAGLVAQSLVEIGLVGVRRGAGGETVLKRTRGWLEAALQSEVLSAAERAEAGRALAKIGDPRFETIALSRAAAASRRSVLMPADPTLGFIRIPAGAFLMGEDEEQHER